MIESPFRAGCASHSTDGAKPNLHRLSAAMTLAEPERFFQT
jgi:hypothetical protein